MDRMSMTDAGFYFAEGENTPMHVGSVAVFEGPAPSYGDVIRLLLSKLPKVPRYRQRVRALPLHLSRPLWTDDEHFQILYHVRHTAVPRPGGAEQLRNLAGRVLGQRLDMTKPLWEVYLVEGLADNRWALISKVHHCMVDGVAGTDLMQLIFDTDPAAEAPEPGEWTPEEAPSTASVVAGSLQDAVSFTMQRLGSLPPVLRRMSEAPREILRRGTTIGTALPGIASKLTTPRARSLNGPIGPHRRWAWTETSFDAIKGIRSSLGGTVNDVVLTAITRGFRDLLAKRGELIDRLVVRSMVPVSVRRPDERGSLNNQVSAVFVDLPVAEPDPVARLHSVRRQMDENKRINGAVDARSIIGMGDFVAPTLLALGTRAGIRTGQNLAQTVTTNVPGPRIPLYVLGRKLASLYAYVPIAAGFRISIGIFSYQHAMSMGINADFDAFPDIDVLADGIRAGVDELVEEAERKAASAVIPAPVPAPAPAAAGAAPAAKKVAKKVAKKATKRAPAKPPAP